ncbi:RDD family protein [Actinomycetospora endophytica]|uniref:RDD family protein n=1 Tax=Actinomycetospora endophytica TaxID=2291215 RepID=A0ABS8PIS0_9PSEU|nr:RDD family protein [Actinomycetospora endophytica]MCD2198182.1 RDD family protein [Actinomycetospora endophytica]
MVDTSSGAVLELGATRVSVRRIVQYPLDLFLAGLVLAVIGLVGDAVAPGAGFEQLHGGFAETPRLVAHGGGWPSLIAVIATVAVWLIAFVAVPSRDGRTLGMRLLGLRIRRVDGGVPSTGQYLGRALLLVVDTFMAGLLGLIVMLCSRRRQRVGDHAAGTVVVRA